MRLKEHSAENAEIPGEVAGRGRGAGLTDRAGRAEPLLLPSSRLPAPPGPSSPEAARKGGRRRRTEPRGPERTRAGPKRARSERADGPERSRSCPRRRRGSSSRTGRPSPSENDGRAPEDGRTAAEASHWLRGRGAAPAAARGGANAPPRTPVEGARAAGIGADRGGRGLRWRSYGEVRRRRRAPEGVAGRQAGRSSILLSSVPLQMQFYLSGLYYPFYFLVSLLVIFYKMHLFSYPPDLWTVDLILLGSMGVLEALRLYLGAKGNLTEEESLLGSSLLLTSSTPILALYFLLWAAYVLRIEILLNSILLTLYGLEGVLQMRKLRFEDHHLSKATLLGFGAGELLASSKAWGAGTGPGYMEPPKSRSELLPRKRRDQPGLWKCVEEEREMVAAPFTNGGGRGVAQLTEQGLLRAGSVHGAAHPRVPWARSTVEGCG
uniref:LOW QUALITY PROTEIN: transmembrane protein 80 n=1 Tax=Phascolarctos cinereus TaxID=38626 RepID=A0A6P5JNV1_PHACI|nr:LOW QUALITY PROTEIN: transmembrane protein 80 [Phascolarctos cinereus]